MKAETDELKKRFASLLDRFQDYINTSEKEQEEQKEKNDEQIKTL